ncbi:MAG: hypothetical protein R2778_15890 [Saprospiraceae bacterium]
MQRITCTPMDLLEFGIRVLGTGNGFPVDGNGNPLISIELTCNDLGNLPVELWE